MSRLPYASERLPDPRSVVVDHFPYVLENIGRQRSTSNAGSVVPPPPPFGSLPLPPPRWTLGGESARPRHASSKQHDRPSVVRSQSATLQKTASRQSAANTLPPPLRRRPIGVDVARDAASEAWSGPAPTARSTPLWPDVQGASRRVANTPAAPEQRWRSKRDGGIGVRADYTKGHCAAAILSCAMRRSTRPGFLIGRIMVEEQQSLASVSAKDEHILILDRFDRGRHAQVSSTRGASEHDNARESRLVPTALLDEDHIVPRIFDDEERTHKSICRLTVAMFLIVVPDHEMRHVSVSFFASAPGVRVDGMPIAGFKLRRMQPASSHSAYQRSRHGWTQEDDVDTCTSSSDGLLQAVLWSTAYGGWTAIEEDGSLGVNTERSVASNAHRHLQPDRVAMHIACAVGDIDFSSTRPSELEELGMEYVELDHTPGATWLVEQLCKQGNRERQAMHMAAMHTDQRNPDDYTSTSKNDATSRHARSQDRQASNARGNKAKHAAHAGTRHPR
ncbi:hypothetical protein THASP1DRAFT_22216 [Thamnocephalis sphaerospora]|uniref:Uncharacterized protein n=1 Tax=Thamnocephalis sphaerospora TaxID=78915 RepID=A0A4P9XUT6_9FUNG|nr:hypothetical protein THASP1DRAFT_22216 [Thamnocephalis sphaerospora]|eukprot:RKP10017.1 hypothetical protein THASP1DRAFT_22216 [Thamnocephalis sphaerospora]